MHHAIRYNQLPANLFKDTEGLEESSPQDSLTEVSVEGATRLLSSSPRQERFQTHSGVIVTVNLETGEAAFEPADVTTDPLTVHFITEPVIIHFSRGDLNRQAVS